VVTQLVLDVVGNGVVVVATVVGAGATTLSSTLYLNLFVTCVT